GGPGRTGGALRTHRASPARSSAGRPRQRSRSGRKLTVDVVQAFRPAWMADLKVRTTVSGEENAMSEQSKLISRRDLLRGVGVAGVAAAAGPVSMLTTPDAAAAAEPVAAQAAGAAAPREAFENLTAVEADLLEAIVDRLIPSDALGPGAREARAAHYIDRA